jgi:cytochrome c oxidase cbb3-type subunit 3
VGLVALLLLGACEREERRFSEVSPASDGPTSRPAFSRLERDSSPRRGVQGPYDGNAWAVAEGQRLYGWFNCNGCHAMGGGGIGPALMDDEWFYGSDPPSVFASIAAGRPNGMPAFGDRLGDPQIWQLVAYVRSLSGLLRKDVRPGRADSMAARPAPVATTPGVPVVVPPPRMPGPVR